MYGTCTVHVWYMYGTCTSYVLRPTSYVLRPTSYVLRPTSYVIRPTSYVLYQDVVLPYLVFGPTQMTSGTTTGNRASGGSTI